MAYGLLLYKQITTDFGVQRIEIQKDGYTGSAIELQGLHKDGITISKDSSDLTEPIVTSVMTISLSDCGEVDFSQFFTPNATLYKVYWKTDGATRWIGFITPDSYSENLAYRDTITLTARDNLGRLNDYDFDMAKGQMVSVNDIIIAAKAKCGLAMTTFIDSNKVATAPATVYVTSGLVNTTLLQGMTWYDALSTVLRGLGLTMQWTDNGNVNVQDISTAPNTTMSAFFISKSGYRQIRPAWKNLTASQDYGIRDNFYEGQFTRADCGTSGAFTPPQTSKWTGTSDLYLINPYIAGFGSPYITFGPHLCGPGGSDAGLDGYFKYSFVVPEMQRAIKISLKCNNTAFIATLNSGAIAQTRLSMYRGTEHIWAHYWLRFRFNIFFTVGTTKYVMREEWQEYDPTTIEEPYLYFVMPGTEGGLDMENEVSFYIAELPDAGTIDFVVYPPLPQDKEDGEPWTQVAMGHYAKITDIEMIVDDSTGGRTDLITINADHNVQNSVTLNIGQVPQGRGNSLLYLGGLFYNDTYYTPLSSFAWYGQTATTYDLLEMVAREYITYNNDNYNALSGTMMATEAFNFGKGITFDSDTYRIVGASLSILSNTLNATLLQQEATFDTANYTIEEVDSEGGYSARGGYSGGSVPQGGASSGGYFYKQDEDNIATDYDINIVQEEGSGSGSGSGDATYKNISKILRHLSLQVVNEGAADEYTVLLTDIAFASASSITAGGIGQEGSGSGGSIATLADVELTSLAPGQILRYDSTTSHWVNTTLALSALSDVALGTPSDGQALVYDSDTGKWVPGTVGSSVTVINNDATIGTSSTTLATINGAQITAKVAAPTVINNATTIGTSLTTIATVAGTPITAKIDAPSVTVINNDATIGTTSTLLATVGGTQITAKIASQSVTVINNATTIGTTLTTLATVAGTPITAKIDLSAYATQDWVEDKNYITSTALSGYATQTWVGSYYLALEDFTAANIVSTLGNSAVNRATNDANGRTIASQYWCNNTFYTISNTDSTFATSLGVASGYLYLYNKNGTALTSLTGTNLVTAIGNSAVNRATADASGNVFSTAYLRKNTDDTMTANLTIGSSSSNKTLTVYGNITASGNIVAGSASDRRLKKNIRDISLREAADLLTVLHPVAYEWNDKAAELGGLTGVSRGFIADEYLDIIPNAGRKMWGEYDAIDYQQAIPYLVAGWQQQNLRIRILEGEIECLKEDNKVLREAIRR